MGKTRLPLGLLFGCASLVIAGGFAAVILLLTVSQRQAYTESIHDQIELAQRKANLTILEPLLRWEPSLDTLAMKMKGIQAGYITNKSSMPIDLIPFWNDAVPLLREPRINRVFQLVLANATELVAAMATSTLGLKLVGTAIGTTAYGSIITSYPITAAHVENPLNSYINIRDDPAYSGFSMPNKSYWVPSVTMDYFENRSAFEFLYGAPVLFDSQGATIGAVYMGLFMNELIQIVTDARATPATTALLFDYQYDTYLGSSDPSLPTWSVATQKHYTLTNIPSAWIRNIYSTAMSECPPLSCEYARFDHDDDIISSLSMQTQRIHFVLIQVTPRKHFFGDWDRNLAVGVAVGITAAVVVLAACVVLWLIIWRNISTLQEAMQLASEMRNDEAHSRSTSAPSFLTEIGAIQSAFEAMNHRLLLARPFLPQSLLVANLNDANGNESEPDEGSPTGAHIEMPDVLSADSEVVAPAEQRPSSVANSTYEAPPLPKVSVGAGLRTDALTVRTIAVLSINVRNFHEMIRKLGPESVQRVHCNLCNIIEQKSNCERGIVDSLHGDRFIVTFNVARPVSRAAQIAASVALGIVEDIEAHQILAQRHPLSIGFASGRALVGNMGTDTIKKLSSVGAVFPEAIALERVSRWVGTSCVMSDRAKHEADQVVRTFFLGYVKFLRKQQTQPADAEATSDTKDGSDSQKKVFTTTLPHPATTGAFHPNIIPLSSVAPTTITISTRRPSAPVSTVDQPMQSIIDTNSNTSNYLNNTSGSGTAALTSVAGGGALGNKSEKKIEVAGASNSTNREVYALMHRIDLVDSEEWLYALKTFKDTNPFKDFEQAMRSTVVGRGGKHTSFHARSPSGPTGNAYIGGAGSFTGSPTPPIMPSPASNQITRTASEIIRPSSGVSASGSSSNELPEQDPTLAKASHSRTVEWAEKRVKDILAYGTAPTYDVSR